SILKEQSENTKDKRDTLREMGRIARHLKRILEENPLKLDRFGDLLHEAWELKKTVASNISNDDIDHWYQRAREAGAQDGKILGAGSGGFLMLFCPIDKRTRVREELRELRPFEIRFESQGSKIIFMD